VNTHELADLLECACCAYQKEAATMLRRQADEITVLHQVLGYEGVAVGQEYMDECVADLRKAQEK
jgi:hypothetical protein